MHTAPQRQLLKEFASRFAVPKPSGYTIAKIGLGSEESKNADNKQGKRSGNTAGGTVKKPEHKRLMGINNPHETLATNRGRPESTGTRPEGDNDEDGSIASMSGMFRSDPTGLIDLGAYPTYRISPENSQRGVSDSSPMHKGTPLSTKHHGPSETPGKHKPSQNNFGHRYGSFNGF